MPGQSNGKAHIDPQDMPRSPAEDLEYMGALIDSMKSIAFENKFLMLGEILRLALMEIQRTKSDIKS